MMNPNAMDAFTREFWEMGRMEIIHRRTQELLDAMASGVGVGGGGKGGGSGGDPYFSTKI